MNGIMVTLSESNQFDKISDKYMQQYGYNTAEDRDADFLMLQKACADIKNHAKTHVESMIFVGKILAEIRDSGIYRACSRIVNGEEMGYTRFDDFCENVFKVSSTKAKNAIRLYEKFNIGDGKIEIKPEYQQYEFSQLVELASLPEEEHARINPGMSVKEIREIKHELKKTVPEVLPGQVTLEEVAAAPIGADEPAEPAKNNPTSDCLAKDEPTPEYVYKYLFKNLKYEGTVKRLFKHYDNGTFDRSGHFVRTISYAGLAIELKDILGYTGSYDGKIDFTSRPSDGITFSTLDKNKTLPDGRTCLKLTWNKAAHIVVEMIERGDIQRPAVAEPAEPEEEFHYVAPTLEDEDELDTADVAPTYEDEPTEESEQDSPTSDYDQGDHDLALDLINFDFMSVRLPKSENQRLKRLADFTGIDKRAIASYAIQKYIDELFINGNVIDSCLAAYEKDNKLTLFVNSDKCPNQYKGGDA